MKVLRRDFLKWGVAQAMVLGTVSRGTPARAQSLARQGLSIQQGATDETKTQFSILHNVSQKIDVFVTDSTGQRISADMNHLNTFSNHPEAITKCYFNGLNPSEDYLLHVVDSSYQKLLDKREFRTLDLNKISLRFAVCSCMNEEEHKPEIWRNMVQNNPDVIFFIGDAVYADTGAPSVGADPAYLWKRFSEARRTLEIYYSKKLVPIIAVWDDHDFGKNNSNCHDYPYVKESQQNFLTFFAQEPEYCSLLERGPGISSAFRYQNQLFVLMDDRTFRDEKGSKNRYAHWGKEQELWMLDLVARNNGPAWIMNGSQIFPAMPFKEALSSDHKVQFEGVTAELRKLTNKVVFVSGDVHYSEISKIEAAAVGYVTYELTSSSIHSRNVPGAPDIFPNDRRIASTGHRNYIIVESVAKGSGVDFIATSYAANGQIRFQKNLRV
jgi:alkaline phosphatase D